MAGITSKQKSPTLTKESSTAEFNLHAPQARNVSVAGTFNNWNTGALKLTKDFRGNWSGSLRLKPGRYQYRYFVDGNWWDDPKAKSTIQNEFGTKNALLDVR